MSKLTDFYAHKAALIEKNLPVDAQQDHGDGKITGTIDHSKCQTLCKRALALCRHLHFRIRNRLSRLSAIRLHGRETRLHHPLGSAACLKQELRHQVPHGR